MMKSCFGCLRRIRLLLSKKQNKKWLVHLDNYCSANINKLAWCELFIDNEDLVKQYENIPQELEREIKNTNIASEVTRIIVRHYQMENNFFRFAIDLFASYAKLKYSDIVNPSKVTLNKLVSDFQEFVNLTKDLLVLYYSLEERQIHGEDLFYKQGLPNLVISLLFQTEDLNSTVIKIIKNCYKQPFDKIAFHLQKFGNTAIQDYGVADEYSLTRKTVDRFGVAKQKQVYERPFVGSVQIVREIVRVGNPIDKLHLLQSLPKQIESSVKQFYKNHSIKKQISQIEAQSIQAIMLYLIVQANQVNLAVHIQITNHFAHNHNEGKKKSACLNIFNQCLEMLAEGTIKKRNSTNIKIEFREDDMDFKTQASSKNYFDEVSSLQL